MSTVKNTAVALAAATTLATSGAHAADMPQTKPFTPEMTRTSCFAVSTNGARIDLSSKLTPNGSPHTDCEKAVEAFTQTANIVDLSGIDSRLMTTLPQPHPLTSDGVALDLP